MNKLLIMLLLRKKQKTQTLREGAVEIKIHILFYGENSLTGDDHGHAYKSYMNHYFL
jgi:hypothetical protein